MIELRYDDVTPPVEEDTALLVFGAWFPPPSIQTWEPNHDCTKWCLTDWGEFLDPGDAIEGPYAVVRRHDIHKTTFIHRK